MLGLAYLSRAAPGGLADDGVSAIVDSSARLFSSQVYLGQSRPISANLGQSRLISANLS